MLSQTSIITTYLHLRLHRRLIFIFFTILSGLSITPIFGQEFNTIGMSVPLKGPNSLIGIELYRGAAAYCEEVNASGGVNGIPVKLVAYDDGQDPAIAIKNTISLVEFDDAKILLNYYSGVTTLSVLPLLRKYSKSYFGPVTLVGPFDGSRRCRVLPYSQWVVNSEISYIAQCEQLVEFLNKAGLERFAIAYQRDADGRAIWDGLSEALLNVDKKIIQEVAFRSTEGISKNHEQYVQLLKKNNPDVLIVVGPYSPCGALIESLFQSDWKPLIACLPMTGKEPLIRILLSKGVSKEWIANSLLFVDTTPEVDDFSDLHVYRYRESMGKYPDLMPEGEEIDANNPPFHYSTIGLRGYLNAKLAVSLISKKHSNNDNFGGAVFHNSNDQQSHLKAVSFSRYQNDRFRKISKEES